MSSREASDPLMSKPLHLFGTDLFGDPIKPESGGPLADRFIVPPFTVLNAREGAWQERKRAWLSLGIQSEVGRGVDMLGLKAAEERFFGDKEAYAAKLDSGAGRGDNLLGMSEQASAPGLNFYRDAEKAKRLARPGGGAGGAVTVRNSGDPYEGGEDAWIGVNGNGTSIFDPVLCELAYRWFSPPDGLVLDPFAGGSVRGIVAAKLDRNYVGVDLREEQVAANEAQAKAICNGGRRPEWYCGDSVDVLASLPVAADFIFSCPPYGDLEVYSEDARDLSTMEHHTFLATYKLIIHRACKLLKPNRFACFVVGDFRDGRGVYRNFVSETIAAFLEQGLHLYNEAILVTAVGSLPIRAGKIFSAGRKLGKSHQNVLVFVKGDPKQAAQACGEVTV